MPTSTTGLGGLVRQLVPGAVKDGMASTLIAEFLRPGPVDPQKVGALLCECSQRCDFAGTTLLARPRPLHADLPALGDLSGSLLIMSHVPGRTAGDLQSLPEQVREFSLSEANCYAAAMGMSCKHLELDSGSSVQATA